MRCDVARAQLSAQLEGEPVSQPETLADHVGSCGGCTAFVDDARRIRRHLRFDTTEGIPDVAPATLAAVSAVRRPRRRWLAVAAAFVVGAVAGGALVWGDGGGPDQAVAQPLPERVAAAQPALQQVSAELRLTERGWHPDVPIREFTGTLQYQAPETLVLRLDDQTAYPSADWQSNDTTLVVTDDGSWASGLIDCPTSAQPECTPNGARIAETVEREPFTEAPLDLVLPVQSFAGADDPAVIGERSIAGRSAIGVEVTAAQVEPLLSALRPAGNLRQAHPTDVVELWLDDETLTPLEVRVFPSDAFGRDRWAIANGYLDDDPAQPVLELSVTAIDVNQGEAVLVPTAAAGAATVTTEGSFTDGPFTVTELLRLDDYELHRTGAVQAPDGPRVEVVTWTDGRAWIKLRATDAWEGDRLFGDIGPTVRTTALPGVGTVHISERGDAVALHGSQLDAVVTGSVGEAQLLEVLRALGEAAAPLPPDWSQAANASLPEAARSLEGLLLPGDVGGFSAPGLAVRGETVVASYAGPGTRAFTLAQSRGQRLAPPLDVDVVGVRVRDADGRYSIASGQLEWVEDGRVHVLTSATLSLGELLAIAASMEPV